MTFTMPQYPVPNKQQSSPYADLIKNALQAYQLGVQSKYMPQMAEQDLQKSLLMNEWYPKLSQSEISLRGAQAGLVGAQTDVARTEMQQNLLKLKYMKSLLSGNQPSDINTQPLQTIYNNQQPVSSENYQSTSQNNSQQGPVSDIPEIYRNSIYGVETPNPSSTDIANKMFLGIDTFSDKLKNAQDLQKGQYNKFQEELQDSVKQANAANDMDQALSMFNNAMDNSFYKGATVGKIPSAGWQTMFMGNVSEEQKADRAALQMLPSAIETLKNAMGTAKFSNLDMNMATQLKFDRTMDDDTRKVQTAWVNAINDRMKERAKFYAMIANNPKSGANKATADMLFQQYQNDFPLISKDGKTVLRENLNNWPLYTTPKAIKSIKEIGTYTPSSKEKNAYMMLIPDGSGGYMVAPIKKGRVESAFKKGAKPL